MILLGVNIDHCATLRQARYRESGRTTGGNVEPDPVTLAVLAERAGADGITVHLREDRRHIQERDVWRLRETIATRLNLEMACTPAMTEFALKLKPDSVCLVPENRQEITTEGGLDVVGKRTASAPWSRRCAPRASSPVFSSVPTRRRSNFPPGSEPVDRAAHRGLCRGLAVRRRARRSLSASAAGRRWPTSWDWW